MRTPRRAALSAWTGRVRLALSRPWHPFRTLGGTLDRHAAGRVHAHECLCALGDPHEAIDPSACDRIGCVGILADGRSVALVLDEAAFAEDCLRADIVVTPLYAPPGCAVPLVIDRDRLRGSSAMLLRAQGKGWAFDTARALDNDRPWSRAPPAWARARATPDANRNGNASRRRISAHHPHVMAGFMPAIHDLLSSVRLAWIAGTSPAMRRVQSTINIF
jgi:hypothetical protein